MQCVPSLFLSLSLSESLALSPSICCCGIWEIFKHGEEETERQSGGGCEKGKEGAFKDGRRGRGGRCTVEGEGNGLCGMSLPFICLPQGARWRMASALINRLTCDGYLQSLLLTADQWLHARAHTHMQDDLYLGGLLYWPLRGRFMQNALQSECRKVWKVSWTVSARDLSWCAPGVCTNEAKF